MSVGKSVGTEFIIRTDRVNEFAAGMITNKSTSLSACGSPYAKDPKR
jgi:hypothetical protein